MKDRLERTELAPESQEANKILMSRITKEIQPYIDTQADINALRKEFDSISEIVRSEIEQLGLSPYHECEEQGGTVMGPHAAGERAARNLVLQVLERIADRSHDPVKAVATYISNAGQMGGVLAEATISDPDTLALALYHAQSLKTQLLASERWDYTATNNPSPQEWREYQKVHGRVEDEAQALLHKWFNILHWGDALDKVFQEKGRG